MTSLALVFSLATLAADPAPTVRVGSKTFTESVILGEMAARVIREAGTPVVHRRELGGTQVLFHGLESGEIDVYPEYTGTIAGEILAGKGIKDEAVDARRPGRARRGDEPVARVQRQLRDRDARGRGRAAGHPRLQRPQEASRPEIRIQQRVHGTRRRLARPPRPLRAPPARRPRARPRPGLSGPGRRRDPGHRPLLDRRRDQGQGPPRPPRRPAASSRPTSASGSTASTCRTGLPRPSRPWDGSKAGSTRPPWPP